MCLGLSSSKGWTSIRDILDNSMRHWPILCSSSSAFGSTANARSAWEQDFSSDFASRSSSLSASSSSIPRTYRWILRAACHSTWDNFSRCHSSQWAFIACEEGQKARQKRDNAQQQASDRPATLRLYATTTSQFGGKGQGKDRPPNPSFKPKQQ